MKKLIAYFTPLSPVQLAERELVNAQRALLVALSEQEYSRRMCEFNADRVKRLTAYLNA